MQIQDINPLDYPLNIFKDDEGDYIVTSPSLPGCSAFGETIIQALDEFKTAAKLWLKVAKDKFNDIPAFNPPQDIGQVLKNLRHIMNMTQKELADIVHTQKSAISRIENHSDNITLAMLKKLVEAFGKKLEISIY